MTATMAGRAGRCKGSQGQRESTLQSRQPRGCKASVLCISLWMVSANRLVSCRTAVDERGCGKVDNSQGTSLAQQATAGTRYANKISFWLTGSGDSEQINVSNLSDQL